MSMTHLNHMMIALAALSVAACSRQAPSPTTDPSVVITRFMDAVAAEDYEVMGQLFGTNDGPAVESGADSDRWRYRDGN